MAYAPVDVINSTVWVDQYRLHSRRKLTYADQAGEIGLVRTSCHLGGHQSLHQKRDAKDVHAGVT